MKVYNIKMLSRILDLPDTEILELINSGELEGSKIAGEWSVSERQVREYLENNEESAHSNCPYWNICKRP